MGFQWAGDTGRRSGAPWEREEFKQGTEGVRSCIDNGVAVEERKARLKPEDMGKDRLWTILISA